ncbi:MAG: efflux RND transporter periplasmic adaptor subunit [Chitinophagaceae bacterium]|jgi:RND family efflux transporter MFP subunit|nr:efflux RND transporter periplasmic adaptor subunit [Chitinophagaceae bacterium]
MKRIILLSTLFFLAACGSGKKETNAKLTDMKVELETLRKQRDGLSDKITQLEKTVASLDTAAVAEAQTKLVQTSNLVPQSFSHYIELQGKIVTENMYYVSPRGMGGQVKAIYVKQGDVVKKGQLLMKLDDAIVNQQIASLKTQLNFVKDIYNRQKNLWAEGIGTEVQLLTSKNNVESLEKQISIVAEQLAMSNVYSEVSGVIETVSIRVGETFMGGPMAGITIVDPSNLKAVVEIPENYMSKVKKGLPVIIELPDLNKQIKSVVSLVSQVIGVNNRSFNAEARIGADASLKPNQGAVIKILDHESSNAIVVPVATVQTDENGKYVYLMVTENGKFVARKKQIIIGELYDDLIEVKSGLTTTDKLVTQGYQGLYDGQLLSIN